jgi:hypothetical protein
MPLNADKLLAGGRAGAHAGVGAGGGGCEARRRWRISSRMPASSSSAAGSEDDDEEEEEVGVELVCDCGEQLACKAEAARSWSQSSCCE